MAKYKHYLDPMIQFIFWYMGEKQVDEDVFEKYKLQPLTVSEQSYSILRKMIMNGELKAGKPLVVSKLADALKTSRTPLREAIKKLEEGGWVRRQTNGIVVVAEVSIKEMKEYYSVRALLEGLAAREATEKISDKEIEKIEKQFLQYDEIKDEKQVLKIVELGEEFHNLIHRASNNEVCMRLLDQIKSQLNRYRIYSVSAPGRYEQALREHLKILNFIRERNAVEAEKAMREHILNAREWAIQEHQGRI